MIKNKADRTKVDHTQECLGVEKAYKAPLCEQKEIIQMNLYIYIRHTHRQRKQIYGYKWGTKWGEWGLRETTTIHKIHKQQGTIFSSL